MTDQADDRNGIIWLAGYPKSGNTWLRCLLEAYRRNGLLDINDVRVCHADSGLPITLGVSPTPTTDLGWRGEALLRPAALLNLFCRLPPHSMLKTHWANIQPEGLPPSIPFEFTDRAVYVVRDPRSVAVSMAPFYGFTSELTIKALAEPEFRIGGNDKYAVCLVSSWSRHVTSWACEERFPVCVIKYEELLEDTEKYLTEVLEFLGWELDEERVKKAVKASTIDKLKQQEESDGFRESSGKAALSGKGFFTANGGSRWRDELGPKYVRQIEKDHGKVMKLLGYELAYETGLEEQEGNVYGLRSIESGN